MTGKDPNQILLHGSYALEELAEAMLDMYYVPMHYLAYSILGDADEAVACELPAVSAFLDSAVYLSNNWGENYNDQSFLLSIPCNLK